MVLECKQSFCKELNTQGDSNPMSGRTDVIQTVQIEVPNTYMWLCGLLLMKMAEYQTFECQYA